MGGWRKAGTARAATILRIVFNNAVVCTKNLTKVRFLKWNRLRLFSSAIVATHGNWNKGWLHQAPTAVVVIGIKEQPEGQCNSHDQAACRENFNHALSLLLATLIRFAQSGAISLPFSN